METNENKIATTPCKVCEKPILLTAEFCSNCGFPNIIYPDSIPKKVQDYENDRVKKYKDLWESKNKGEDLPPLCGYLIVIQDEDFQQIFPVYKGKNVFGKNPRCEDELFRNVIELDCDDLRNENFSLETDQKGFVVAKLIEGIWSIGYWGNSPQERILSNGDSILINDLKFIFIAK